MKNLFKKIVALGLAATMAMGMAVTSYAADGNDSTIGVSGDTITFDGIKAGDDIKGPWLTGNKNSEFGNLTETTVKVTATAPEGGKIIVGAVDDIKAAAPEVTKGKITTKSDIVKVSYKAETGIVIKANKSSGTARVWTAIIDGDKNVTGYSHFDVVVKAAANKVKLTQTIGASTNDVKKIAIPVGQTATIDITGLSKEKDADGELKAATEATYTATVDSKFAENVSAKIENGKLVVEALALNKDEEGNFIAKTVSAKVTVTCAESLKKATVTIMVTNPATDIAPKFADDSNKALLYVNDTATVTINAVTVGEGMPTTDKVKVYVAAPAAKEVKDDEGNVTAEAIEGLKLSEDGKKVEFTKSKAVAAKLNNDGTVTLTRKEVFEEAEIWLSYTDVATKEIKLEKLAFIEKVVPTEGDVALGNNAAANYAE